MTPPAVVVSVIRAAATGLPASGTKVIQRVLPAGQEGTVADRHFLRNSTTAGSRGGRHLTMLPCGARRRDGGGAERERAAGSGRHQDGLRLAGGGSRRGPYVSERQRGRAGGRHRGWRGPGTTCRTITRGRAPAGGARTAWPGSATSSSGCARDWRCGTGATRSCRSAFGLTGAQGNHGEHVKDHWWRAR